MGRCVGAAARLPGSDRKDLAIQALARSETVGDLAARHGVSRKFVYQQTFGSIRICGVFTLQQLGQHRFHRRRRAPDTSSNGSRSVLSSVGDVNTPQILMLPC